MKKILLIISLLLIQSISYSQIVTIASIRQNDGDGVPLLMGQQRTIAGIVTAKFGAVQSFIQDYTAGTSVYDATFTAGVNVGDSVVLTGTITHYNGLFQIAPVSSFTVASSGNNVTLVVVTLSQYATQQWNGFEQYEGRLLRINGVTVSGSGNWGSNVNYTVTDPSGTFSNMLRIVAATNIPGTQIPSGVLVDFIVIGGQFKTSVPYSSGYQVQPRSVADIIPTIGSVEPPVESNITQNSVTLNWVTTNPADSKIKYFISDSLNQPVVYTDSVYVATLTTNHSITINNLLPGRIYCAQILSNGTGGNYSYSPKYFSTASHSTSRGIMTAYFNYSVDTSVALPNNKANGIANFVYDLGKRIDSANHSIDMAIYSFADSYCQPIADKIVQAAIRGVKIRIVYDSRNNQDLITYLLSAGIQIIKRPENSSNYIMHNKFLIFDSRDTSSYSDDWLWTGSTNLTYDQTAYGRDVNNVIMIQDESLCKAYTREFEEMWGSHNNNYNSSAAKFGSQKLDNTPHIFTINNKKVEVYFSPSDNLPKRFVEVIKTANKSVNFSMLLFTRDDFSDSLRVRYNPPNLMVRGVFDTSNAFSTGSEYSKMKGYGSNAWNPPARVYTSKYKVGNDMMQYHHKYMVVDPDLNTSSPVVWTGSFNWTASAATDNDENVLIIYDSLVANQYYQEFAQRIKESGGTVGVQSISSEIPQKFELSQNYPNPFNPLTNIGFSVPVNSFVTLKIFDILGREVAILINNQMQAGKYEYKFNADNLKSGVYFYSFTAKGFSDTKKLVIVK